MLASADTQSLKYVGNTIYFISVSQQLFINCVTIPIDSCRAKRRGELEK